MLRGWKVNIIVPCPWLHEHQPELIDACGSLPHISIGSVIHGKQHTAVVEGA